MIAWESRLWMLTKSWRGKWWREILGVREREREILPPSFSRQNYHTHFIILQTTTHISRSPAYFAFFILFSTELTTRIHNWEDAAKNWLPDAAYNHFVSFWSGHSLLSSLGFFSIMFARRLKVWERLYSFYLLEFKEPAPEIQGPLTQFTLLEFNEVVGKIQALL